MEYGRVHTDGSRSGGQKPVDVVEKVARAIHEELGRGSGDYTDAARAAIAAMLEAVGEPEGWLYAGIAGRTVRPCIGTARKDACPSGWTETPLYSLSPLT